MRSVLLLALAALTGCAPHYTRPDAPIADAFPGAEVAAGAQAESSGWRDSFPDPTLQDLIERALSHNRGFQATGLAIEQARAQLRLASSALGPSVSLGASHTDTRTPASVSPFGQSFRVTRFGVGPEASWELDLFGRLRHQRRAAVEQVAAAEEDWRAARLALIAQVADTAVQEQALAEQARLARETLDNRAEVVELMQMQLDAGLLTDLELRQAEALVASAQVSLARLDRAAALAHNALVLLVGEPVAPLPASGESVEGLVETTLPAGLPSSLLTQRPDIRAAEHRLIAAHANIGAARAAFFPQISLTGSLNTASASLLGLFQPETLAWSFVAPTITQPIFAWGSKRASLRAAEIARERAVADYEAAIQAAFREVADVLVSWPTVDAEVDAQQVLLDTQADRLRLAEARYDAGVSDYIDVLDAERERFSAELALVSIHMTEAQLGISWFRVIGGGTESTAPLTPEP